MHKLYINIFGNENNAQILKRAHDYFLDEYKNSQINNEQLKQIKWIIKNCATMWVNV